MKKLMYIFIDKAAKHFAQILFDNLAGEIFEILEEETEETGTEKDRTKAKVKPDKVETQAAQSESDFIDVEKLHNVDKQTVENIAKKYE